MDSSSSGGAAGRFSSAAKRSLPVGQEPTLRERLEARRDHPGQAFGQRVELVAATYERAGVLRTASDELRFQAELLAEPDSTLLPREEAVGGALDHEPVDVLRQELSAETVRRLDQDDLDLLEQGLEPAGRREPRDPPADDDDSHAAAAASQDSARTRTRPASVETKSGSSFSAGGRSSRTSSRSAISFARTSTSNRSST